MLQRGIWQPNQRQMSMTLRMMMMTMIDSGITYYNCFCAMLSSLKSYHIFVVKQHIGSIVVSLIWKRRWQFFKTIMAVCIYVTCSCIAIHDKSLTKLTMCQLKILFQFLLMFNEWFSFWLESVQFLHSRHSSSVLLTDSEDWYKYKLGTENVQHNWIQVKSFGARAFRVAALKIWNSIPLHIRQSQTYSSFRRHLKTHYFISAHLAP